MLNCMLIGNKFDDILINIIWVLILLDGVKWQKQG